MDYSKRNTAFLLIGTGIYLAVGHLAGFALSSALVLALLGFVLIRTSPAEEERKNYAGYALFGAAALLVLANHTGLLLLAVAGVAAWYYLSKRNITGNTNEGQADNPLDPSFVKQHLAASIRWGRGGEAWTARSAMVTAAVAEVAVDLTNAIYETPEIVLQLQGMIGDIDVVVPEDIGLSVHAQVAVGELRVAGERAAGLGNRLVWRSPNYDMAEYRVQLQLSYAVADVKVKVL